MVSKNRLIRTDEKKKKAHRVSSQTDSERRNRERRIFGTGTKCYSILETEALS